MLRMWWLGCNEMLTSWAVVTNPSETESAQVKLRVAEKQSLSWISDLHDPAATYYLGLYRQHCKDGLLLAMAESSLQMQIVTGIIVLEAGPVLVAVYGYNEQSMHQN